MIKDDKLQTAARDPHTTTAEALWQPAPEPERGCCSTSSDNSGSSGMDRSRNTEARRVATAAAGNSMYGNTCLFGSWHCNRSRDGSNRSIQLEGDKTSRVGDGESDKNRVNDHGTLGSEGTQHLEYILSLRARYLFRGGGYSDTDVWVDALERKRDKHPLPTPYLVRIYSA